jgi:eukaryotic-like serine/threonine-protein kinase
VLHEGDLARAGPTVAPGAVSALLVELAHAPLDAREVVPPFHVGQVVGRFELVREIGRGGFGVVFEARDRELARSVAFKAVRGRVNPDVREERLLLEAEAAARLSHPNIITLYDVGRCEQGPYLVLELLRGSTLGERMAQGPIPVREALRVAREVAKGLAHAHERGIVHRDLTPGNVFLCQDGQVKVLDFGLSHAFGQRKVEGGTRAYMAPEQARGAPEDERTDVFALGVIVYRMLANALPFPDRGARGEDGGEPYVPPAAVEVPGVPAAARLLARMLDVDPVKRPRDAGQVVAGLAEIEGELERADPARVVARVRPRSRTAGGLEAKAERRRRRGWRLALVLAVVVGLAGSALYLRRERAENPLPPSLPAERRLAVLPFANEGASDADAAFAAGLRETVTNALFQVEPFASWRFVSAREVLLGKIASAKEARAAFGATLALEGTLRWRPRRVKVTANLVDTKTQELLVTRDFDLPRSDADALERELVDRVVEMMELKLAAEQRRRLAPAKPAPGAYEFYVQARGYLQRYDRVENLEAAVAAFDRALQIDPRYPPALAGRAEASLRRYDATKDARFLNEARADGRRALDLGAQLAQVQRTLGLVHEAAGEHDEAILSFERAIELDPRDADAYRELANAYDAAGRLDRAEATYRRAIEIRPGSWAAYGDLGSFYGHHGRLGEALSMFQRVLAITPDNYAGYTDLGAALFRQGRQEEAADAWQKSLALHPSDRAYSNLATLRYYQRRYGEAADLFRKAVELNPTDARTWGYLGDAERWSGREAQAKEDYRRAVALLDEQLQVNPRDLEARSRLAMHLASIGERERSLEEIAEALRRGPRDGYVLFRAALVYEAAGRRERALEAASGAVAAGHPRAEIENAPPLAKLRSDPRYPAALQGTPGWKAGKPQ